MDDADHPPYGDRSSVQGASPIRAEWNERAVGLAVLAILTSVGALAGALYCIWIVVAAPEGGGVNFALGYVGLAVICLAVIAGCVMASARAARRR